MENQNTRLINPRENRKIHLLTRFTGNNLRQTEPVYRLQRNPSSHEPSKETFRHYTPFPPPNNLIANVDLRATITSIHELPLESIASTQRWKNLFISGTFRNSENPISDKKLVPSDRKGASAPSSFGETKTRQTNVSVTERHNLDDGWHANRWYLRSATFSAHHLWIGWTRIERCTKKISRVSFFSFFFLVPFDGRLDGVVEWSDRIRWKVLLNGILIGCREVFFRICESDLNRIWKFVALCTSVGVSFFPLLLKWIDNCNRIIVTYQSGGKIGWRKIWHTHLKQKRRRNLLELEIVKIC